MRGLTFGFLVFAIIQFLAAVIFFSFNLKYFFMGVGGSSAVLVCAVLIYFQQRNKGRASESRS